MIFDLHLSDEQRLLAESLHTFFGTALPVERLRHSTGFGGQQERTLWNELVDLGVFGFAIPESDGLPEEVLAAQALGRFCVSSTVLATMVAAQIAILDGRQDLCRSLCEGKTRACIGNPLGGGKVHLVDAADCDWVVYLGTAPSLIPRSKIFSLRSLASLDEGTTLERGELDGGKPALRPWGDRASLMIAGYLVGNSQATLNMAIAHVTTREQFGQAIGAFQGIKFGCADMAVRAAAAEAQTFYAAMRGAGDNTESTAEIASARLLARSASIDNAKANIQFHGAMGFTAESDAHHYLKRALLFASFGSDQRKEERQILAPWMTSYKETSVCAR
jgi:alkylation response protein AidB-like acyl-CoA dehydrogenase